MDPQKVGHFLQRGVNSNQDEKDFPIEAIACGTCISTVRSNVQRWPVGVSALGCFDVPSSPMYRRLVRERANRIGVRGTLQECKSSALL